MTTSTDGASARPDGRLNGLTVVAINATVFAAIAQLVEHRIRNAGVGGSNPSCGTKLSKPNFLCAGFSDALMRVR